MVFISSFLIILVLWFGRGQCVLSDYFIAFSESKWRLLFFKQVDSLILFCEECRLEAALVLLLLVLDVQRTPVGPPIGLEVQPSVAADA